ncbi:MAG: SDR family NAD(P)-dependent oxidoreductase [Bacteroidales bacterium]|nr:SDR family NAD(P)-dependent oxidoreductase [Bacteroidales bacterium]
MARKIIVTGANGGLGTFITQKLLNDGYEVHGTIIPGGPDPEEVKSTFKNNGLLFLKAVDALNAVETAEYIKQTGEVYGAVLTVGGFQMKPFLKTNDDDLDKMINLNFKTAFHFARPLAEQLKSQKQGHIFFITSKPALEKGGKALTSYSISKHMLIKLSEIVNEEFKGTHASAAALAPDMIDTIPNREAMPDANFDEWIKPVEIADAIAFYLSDKAQRIREPILKLYGNY